MVVYGENSLTTGMGKYLWGGLGDVGVDNLHRAVLAWIEKRHLELLKSTQEVLRSRVKEC